ncbi:MAG: hypothetical protein AAF633_18910 [Chloroflexota bacterium]
MSDIKTFWPTWLYWFKSWIPFGLCLIGVAYFGISDNLGTPTQTRAIGASIVMITIYLFLLIAFAFKHLSISDEGLYVRTPFKSYFWPKEQIAAVTFYLAGKDSDKEHYMTIYTAEEQNKLNLQAFDFEGVEDELEDWLGRERIGIQAARQIERFVKAREEADIETQRDGESKAYTGGSVSLLFFFSLTGLSLLFMGLGYAVTRFEFPIVGYGIIGLTFFWLVWWILLYGRVYINRDHVIYYRWGRTEMVWWRDVRSVDFSYRYIVLHTQQGRLVIPGPRFWDLKKIKKMLTIYIRQMNERQIYSKGTSYFIRPPSRNAVTNQTFSV